MAISSYRQLQVWTKAMAVAKSIYEIAKRMPKQEEYRLTAQMIRASISIPANISEGHTRATRKDYAHFFSIACGSIAELETLLLLAESTSLLPILASVEEVGRMLNALHQMLRAPSP
jgi:four helix bundle protein